MIQSTDLQFLGRAGVNYLLSPGAETGRQGWSLFTTTFTSNVPTTISAGAANCTLTSSTTTPLRGTRSLAFAVTTAAGSAGQGFISDVFTVDNADLAKVLTAAFDYNFSAGGTSVDVSGTTTQTLEIWVYNVGLAAWTQPAGFRGINQNSLPGYVAATFQTDSSNASNKNQYRVAVIIKNAPTGTFTMQVDQAVVGPQTVQYGAPVTDWQTASVGNIVGVSGGSLAVGTGGGATYSAKYRRVGDSAEVSYTLRIGTSGTSDVTGVGNVYLFPYPTGMSPSGLFSYEAIGFGEITAVGSAAPTNRLIAKAYTNGFILDSTDSLLLASGGNLYNNANTLSVVITYKVAGWSSTVQMSNDTDTRVVAAGAYYNAAAIVCPSGSDTLINNYAATTLDTHGQFTISTGSYVVPVSGVYRIETLTLLNGGAGVVSAAFITRLFINNVYTTDIARCDTIPSVYNAASIVYSGSTLVSLNAGQTLTLKIFQNSGQNKTLSGSNVYISRLSGPSAIAATETVAARYTNTAGTALSPTPSAIPFGNKVFDTHGAFSGSTFTAPVSGKYSVSCLLTLNSATLTTAQSFEMMIYKGGVFHTDLNVVMGTGGTVYYRTGNSTVISLNAGEYIQVFANTTVATTLYNGAEYNHVSIVRVGN